MQIEITDFSYEGFGVGKKDNRVYFVENAIPGQIVKIRETKRKSKFSRAKIVEIIKKSPYESCTEHQKTPGAPWVGLPEDLQIQYKNQQISQSTKKILPKEFHESVTKCTKKVIKSPNKYDYRNKMEYSFGYDEKGNPALGSKKRGQFQQVENLENPSGIFDKNFEKHLPKILAFCEETKLPFWNQAEHIGFFRNLVVRKSFTHNQFLISLVTSNNKVNFDPEKFANFLLELFPKSIAGILWKKTNTISDSIQNIETKKIIWGQDFLNETLLDLNFEISDTSFFQPNPATAEIIYQKIIDYTQKFFPHTPEVLDLFCGTGTISQILAKNFPNKKITGIEIIPEAIKNAKNSAKKNKCTDIGFLCEDVNQWRKTQDSFREKVIIMDPPRAGIVPKTLQRILEKNPDGFIYVSCKPTTFFRDCQTLLEHGLVLRELQPIDQFPHTSHLECVSVFTKKDG